MSCYSGILNKCCGLLTFIMLPSLAVKRGEPGIFSHVSMT